MKKRIGLIFIAFIMSVSSFLYYAVRTVAATSTDVNSGRLIDGAEVLTSEEELRLVSMLDKISTELRCDFVVVTVKTLDGENIQKYADDYYDYNGYGYGKDADGILFLLALDERQFAVSTCGIAYERIGDLELDEIINDAGYYLSSREYYMAFASFAENGRAYIMGNKYNSGSSSFEFGKAVIISIAIGFICGLIAVTVMKGKLKSVRQKNQARDYILEDSFNLTLQRDMYLYKTVNRVEKPKEDSSSRGGGHISSSGRTHGGRSGRF